MYLLWSGNHLTSPKDKLKHIWRHENTTMLRTSFHNSSEVIKSEEVDEPEYFKGVCRIFCSK